MLFETMAAGRNSETARLRRSTRLLASCAAALLLSSWGLAGPARAGESILCPSAATPGGIPGTFTATDVPGPLDGACGPNSAVQLSLTASTGYGKLQFPTSMPGFPAGLTLGGISGLSANVSFTSGGSDQPFFALPFIDSSNSLGQPNAGDQILLLEFQPSTLTDAGSTLAADPASTEFNLYDNTGAGAYLLGGQPDTKTIDGWLAAYPSLSNEALQGVWIGTGLTGGNTGAETLTVNSLSVVPEPATIGLLGAALVGLGFSRRRKRAG